jgi:dihydrofolate synthase/folylpolyglutamate synthase
MKYERSISYLYSLQLHGIKLGLDNIRAMCAALKDPQNAFCSAHIAGTNGKGSTAAMLQRLLTASVGPTGLFTSPHMLRFTERIRIDEAEIPAAFAASLTDFLAEIAAGIEGLKPTFFEMVTAMAFEYFRQAAVKWAVFETGMGGRFDATNILSPRVCIISAIAEDHKDFLGDTIEKIAFEKAGIIKPGVPVITTAQDAGAFSVIEAAARLNSSPLIIFGRDFSISNAHATPGGATFDYHGARDIEGLKIPFTGPRQAENAACAICAWEVVSEGMAGLGADFVRQSLAGVKWPGRNELVDFDGMAALLDGAHNPAAMRHLAETLTGVYLNPDNQGVVNPRVSGDAIPRVSPAFKRVILVMGAMADKDTEGMLRAILPVSAEAVFTAPAYGRAERPKRLLAAARGMSGIKAGLHAASTSSEAMAAARALYRPGDLIVVAGSFYILGEIKALMGEDASLMRLTEFR